jgi:eukaryotic-like serine/threonine-protein kinase
VKPPADQQDSELPDRLGEVVAGHYRLDALLGRGGMGCVYRAQHLDLDEPVVVKFIDPAFANNPTARARFRREAKALIRLRHPGIVTMHEFGEHDGGLFLTMELLQGRTLAARLHPSSEPIPLDAVFDTFRQLGEALEAVHAAGIIHRDLKPDNVMLAPTLVPSKGQAERVVLMDFGVASIEEAKNVRMTSTGSLVGTPAYMSPEQCFGQRLSSASDVYSLGAMLFEALCGHRLFATEEPAVMMSRHMFVPPPKLAGAVLGRVISPGLAKLVDDMLSKKPEPRPTATQFLERLEKARTGQDTLSLEANATQRRLADSGKARKERALPHARTLPAGPRPPLGEGSKEPAARIAGTQPLVWLRGFSPERAAVLTTFLAVNGMEGLFADTFAALPKARRELGAAVVAGAQPSRAPELVRELRETQECASLPVLVVDVPDASEMAPLIRAGASDVALAVLGDDVVVSRIWRLIRRKR